MFQPPPTLSRGDALFLDFDGTLVEIAATPQRIEIAAGLPDLLQRVAAQLGGALAVISGRPLDELVHFLAGYTGAAAGIHGLERRSATGVVQRPSPDAALDLIRPIVRQFATATSGATVEDKGLAIAIHYRGRPELADACRQIAEQAVQLSQNHLAMLAGKMVVELRPQAANKGSAAQAFLTEPEFRGRRPIFVGDDRTDEEGFAAVNRLGGFAVHVGDGHSDARYRLTSVVAVIRWLEDALAAG
ncbi:MAG TPA: trehalose-phosphatase [Stellaceae bacterium]|nr:trehalose-phosphatase [Stellaceae bacterium]